MTMQDRPERARGTLTPPTNTDVDPIDARPTTSTRTDTTPPAHTAATAPAHTTVVTPAISATVQSGINWSVETEQLVRAAKNRTGKTRRAIVEEAIAHMWG